MESALYDAAGHRRSPATMPGFHQGRSPRNKGLRYPADPPTIEEIIAVMRAAGRSTDGARLRALIVILWRLETKALVGAIFRAGTRKGAFAARQAAPARRSQTSGPRCVHGWQPELSSRSAQLRVL